ATDSHLEERFGIRPLSQLVLEMPRLVDEDLPVVGQHHARALERPRRRPFEIDAGQSISAAVARALELVFRREVIRRASQMRADRDERIEPARVLSDVVGSPYDPDPKLLFPSLIDAHAVFVRE